MKILKASISVALVTLCVSLESKESSVEQTQEPLFRGESALVVDDSLPNKFSESLVSMHLQSALDRYQKENDEVAHYLPKNAESALVNGTTTEPHMSQYLHACDIYQLLFTYTSAHSWLSYSDECTYTSIVPYDATRDSEFIHGLFIENWTWLMITGPATYTPRYFDVSHLLESGRYRAKGNDSVEVMIRMAVDRNGMPQGFVVYFVDQPPTGRILFLSVSEQYRRTGVATALMKYGMNHLKEQGMTRVFLKVHRQNFGAQRLYRSLGFVEDTISDTSATYVSSLGE